MENKHAIKSRSGPRKTNPVERLRSKIDIQKSSGCWEYTGAVVPSGYGNFYLEGKTVLAHRASWKLFNGDILAGLFVLHSCDNKICVNPAHLFLGTHQDNMNDKVSKNRQTRGDTHYSRTNPEALARGSANGNSKLSEEEVLDIRNSHKEGMAIRALARLHRVSQNAIQCIIRRITWGHI